MKQLCISAWIVSMMFLSVGQTFAKGDKKDSQVQATTEKAGATKTKTESAKTETKAKTQSATKAAETETTHVEYAFDLSQSKLYWEGSKVIGGAHNGHVNLKEGHLVWGASGPLSAHVVVDMQTIVNLDLKSDEKKKDLVGHLKDEDFFYVSKFPTSTLKAESFKQKSGSTYEVTGNMTIRGITKPVAYVAELTQSGEMVKGKGAFTIDRTEFNVKYNSKRFFPDIGDKIIKDEVKLSFEFVAAASKKVSHKSSTPKVEIASQE